jgi:hypothetical protein
MAVMTLYQKTIPDDSHSANGETPADKSHGKSFSGCHI